MLAILKALLYTALSSQQLACLKRLLLPADVPYVRIQPAYMHACIHTCTGAVPGRATTAAENGASCLASG